MKKVILGLLLSMMVILISTSAMAVVIINTDRSSFGSLGAITYNYGFDDYTDQVNTFGYIVKLGDWTSNGVTYTSTENLIGWTPVWLSSSYYGNGTPMLMNNYSNPVTGNIDPNGFYSLFGFDAGYGFLDDNGTTITITTNLNSYNFDVDLSRADDTKFYGFVSDAGEYFTSFNINANEYHTLASIDNVTMGHAGVNAVPEPSTMLLLGVGLAGVGLLRRKSNN